MSEKPVSLEVGESIRLELVLGNVHYCANVKLIGYADAQSLIVTIPNSDMPLTENTEMQARVAYKDGFLSFQTYVLKYSDNHNKYMHLHYPLAKPGQMARKDERITVKPRSIRLTMLDGDEAIQVDLADLSIKGARLIAPKRLGYIDDKFMIDMNIPYSDTVISLPCVIRHIQNNLSIENSDISTTYHHGVCFDELSNDALRFIESFIAENGINRHRSNS